MNRDDIGATALATLLLFYIWRHDLDAISPHGSFLSQGSEKEIRGEVLALCHFATEFAVFMASREPTVPNRVIQLLRGAHELMAQNRTSDPPEASRARAFLDARLREYREVSEEACRTILKARQYVLSGPELQIRVNTYHEQWRHCMRSYQDVAGADRAVAGEFSVAICGTRNPVNILKALPVIGNVRNTTRELLAGYRIHLD